MTWIRLAPTRAVSPSRTPNLVAVGPVWTGGRSSRREEELRITDHLPTYLPKHLKPSQAKSAALRPTGRDRMACLRRPPALLGRARAHSCHSMPTPASRPLTCSERARPHPPHCMPNLPAPRCPTEFMRRCCSARVIDVVMHSDYEPVRRSSLELGRVGSGQVSARDWSPQPSVH